MATSSPVAPDPKVDLATRLGVPLWLVGVIGFIIVGGTTWLIVLETAQSAIKQAMTDLPTQMAGEFDAKLEKLRGDLINEFFLKAQKFSDSANFRQAAAAIDAAAILVSIVKEEKTPPPNKNFFANSVAILDRLGRLAQGPCVLTEPIHRARLELADYRSALQPPLQLPAATKSIAIPLNLQELIKLRGSGLIYDGPPGLDMIKSPKEVSGLYLAEGWQTLDGGEWDNVLFMDMHIRYNGGPVSLKNVIFVNCTFDVHMDPQGARLLDYAILDLQSIKIS